MELRGIDPEDRALLENAFLEFGLNRQIRRALVQERLLGGAVLLPVLLRPQEEQTSSPLDYSTLRKGDLKAVNVVDISRLSRPVVETDPFSPNCDQAHSILINGVDVHASRVCILDGDALFSRCSQSLLESFRFNPCGFGESKLATLYDLLNRVIGTQQGAYHLVNLASCLIVEAENLRMLSATASPAVSKLQEIVEQLSLYRGAVIDAKGAKVSQHNASFGSVPELVMTFAQLLSAASDIPATRFLGQAPGGLNATGDGDRANYYDMVGAYQRLKLMPVQRRVLDWIGSHLWGWETWQRKSASLELVYPGLETMSEQEQASIANTYGGLVASLHGAGMLSKEAAIAELKERKIFVTDFGIEDCSEEKAENPATPAPEGLDPQNIFARLQAENSDHARGPVEDAIKLFHNSNEFKEEDHPRDHDGKFRCKGTGPKGAAKGKESSGLQTTSDHDENLEPKLGPATHVGAQASRHDKADDGVDWSVKK